MGVLALDLWPGPVSRFDLGNALTLDLFTGLLESVTDSALFGGANALAVESSPGVWEIVQAGAVELVALGRYRLTRLLRGQRGTEGAMGNPAQTGARVVVLDSTLAPLPIVLADLGLPWNWRVGPATRPPTTTNSGRLSPRALRCRGTGARPRCSFRRDPRPLRLRASPSPDRSLDHLQPRNPTACRAVQMDAHFAVSFQVQTSNAHARGEWPGQITNGRRGAAWRLRRSAQARPSPGGRQASSALGVSRYVPRPAIRAVPGAAGHGPRVSHRRATRAKDQRPRVPTGPWPFGPVRVGRGRTTTGRIPGPLP